MYVIFMFSIEEAVVLMTTASVCRQSKQHLKLLALQTD